MTWLSRHRHDGRNTSLDDDSTADLSAGDEADAAAIQSSERRRIDRAMAALPVEFREVIVLRELEDLSYREISDVAGVPVGTVMSRLSRARKRLADLLLDAREAS
jgi:RNA polymerase sigma-70 factor (ECF subfamily)